MDPPEQHEEEQHTCCDILSPRRTPLKQQLEGPRFVCCDSGTPPPSQAPSPFSTPPALTRGTGTSADGSGSTIKILNATTGKPVIVRVFQQCALSDAKPEVPPERMPSAMHSDGHTLPEARFEHFPTSREATNITLRSPTATRVVVATRAKSPAVGGTLRFSRADAGAVSGAPGTVADVRIEGSQNRSDSPSFPPSKDTLTELRNQTLSEMEERRQNARTGSPSPNRDRPSSPTPSCRFREYRGDQPRLTDSEVPAYLSSARLAVGGGNRPAGSPTMRRASSFDSVWSSLRSAPGSRFVELLSMASTRMQELRTKEEPELQQQLQLQFQEEQQQRLQEQQLLRRQQLLERQQLLQQQSIAHQGPSPFPATRTSTNSPQRRRPSIPRWGSLSAQKANSNLENMNMFERFWPLATTDETRSLVYGQPDLAPAAAATPVTENMRRLVSCGSMGKMVTMNSAKGVTRTPSDLGKRTASPRRSSSTGSRKNSTQIDPVPGQPSTPASVFRLPGKATDGFGSSQSLVPRSLSASASGPPSVDSPTSRGGSLGNTSSPRSSTNKSSLLRRAATTPIGSFEQSRQAAKQAGAAASSNNNNNNNSNSNSNSSSFASRHSNRNNSHSSSGYSNGGGIATPSTAPTAFGPGNGRRMSPTTTATSATTAAPALMTPHSSAGAVGVGAVGAGNGSSNPVTPRMAKGSWDSGPLSARPLKSTPSSPKKIGSLDSVMRVANTTSATSPRGGSYANMAMTSPRSSQPGSGGARRPLSSNRTGGLRSARAPTARQPVPNAGTISLF